MLKERMFSIETILKSLDRKVIPIIENMAGVKEIICKSILELIYSKEIVSKALELNLSLRNEFPYNFWHREDLLKKGYDPKVIDCAEDIRNG